MAVVYPIISNETQVLISRTKNPSGTVRTYMEPISKDLERLIDDQIRKKLPIRFRTVDDYITQDIVLYGTIDFNSPDDIALIKKKSNLFSNKTFKYTGFNYNDGTITADNRGICIGHDSEDPIYNMMMAHVRIGKPDKVIIYSIFNK